MEQSDSVQLLAVEVDFDDEEDGNYRFLVNGKHVKYITVSSGCLPFDDRTFAPVLIPLLPKFPPGDWNEGHIARDQQTGELVFTWTAHSILRGVENNWHVVKIDHLELTQLARIRQNVHQVSHPQFDQAVVVKFAQFTWQIDDIERETTAYQLLTGIDVAPTFLGHVTEDGRTIGFLMQLVSDARRAGPADLEACQAALTKLHKRGLKHGDVNRHNFLVSTQTGTAMIVDFEVTRRCTVLAELAHEMKQLPEALCEHSDRGGIESYTTSYPPLNPSGTLK